MLPSRPDVEKIICVLIAEVLSLRAAEVTPAKRLTEDLQADDLDTMVICSEIEEEFDIELADETVDGWMKNANVTVDDIIDRVHELTG